jgi:hypothetical protein
LYVGKVVAGKVTREAGNVSSTGFEASNASIAATTTSPTGLKTVTSGPGDFHLKEPATYFSYSEEYGRLYAKRRGRARLVIKQIVHLDMLKQSGKYYNFGCVPNDEWRDVVAACRRREKAQGKLLKIQKRAMLEGPIADCQTY